MPRKRTEPSLVEVVMTSRWPVAAAAAAVCFIVGFLIFPRILAPNIFLVGLAPLARTVSLLAVAGFGIVAVVKFLHEANANRTAAQVTSHLPAVERARERTRHRHPGASDPVAPVRTEPYVRAAPSEWSLALLQSIEWKRFEEVVAVLPREELPVRDDRAWSGRRRRRPPVLR